MHRSEDCSPPSLNLVRLYSPEHGIRGHAEAGEKVAGQESVIPVVSLYGNRTEPSVGELSEIDLFVVDLQDIGARYYTYMATMRNCIAACANAKVPILILDRPNPLGGQVLEGPIATNTESIVSCTPIPIRHGMTMGELAVWFTRNELKALKPNLAISYLDNWQPRRQFAECSLLWVASSPNMPSSETALLYIGTCLLEGTNLNEGRGTDIPFVVMGAPWLDTQRVLAGIADTDLPGLTLTSTTYTPQSIPGKATSPRFMGISCGGIQIQITDAKQVRAFRTMVALLKSIRTTHPEEFAFIPFFDTLAGGSELRERIEAGDSTQAIQDWCAALHQRFETKRPRLYDEDGIPV